MGDTENAYIENNLLISPMGELTAVMDFEESILLSEIGLHEIEAARRWRFGHRNRRLEVYGKITDMV